MNFKKLVSLLLTIAMVLSMVAALGITASAGQLPTWVKVEKYGMTFWYLTGKVTHTEYQGDEEWVCECWEESGLSHGKFAYDLEHDSWWDDCTCDHIVTSEPLTSIEIKPNSAKTSYTVGDKIDLTGTKISAATISGTTTDVNVTSSMVSGFDSTTAGKKTVTVTYKNCTTSFEVTVSPKNECFLDLESSTAAIKDSKSIDQNYSLTVSTGSYTDVTKVKVEWTLQDITAARTDSQIWDPDTLSWVKSGSTVTANSATASFHLTNLSSVKVDAKVEFAAVAGFDPAIAYTGVDATSHKTTLNTVVTGTDVDTAITHDATVTVKVTPSTTDFTNAAATDSAKYGTYTVTLLPASAVYSITSNLGERFTADENNPTTIAAGGTAVLKYTIDENYGGEVDVTVTGADHDEPDHDEANGIVTVTIKNPTGDVTVSVAECLAEGTKITMADRSVKNIEDITTGEMVLTFNHETGKFEGQAVYLAYAGLTPDNGTELTFSDGTTLTIVGEHDLFEQGSMKYVTLTRSNAKSNIGKHYYNAETGKFVTLTAVNTTAPVNYYSLYTAYNANCIANGMLTVPDDTEYTLNIYAFNDDLTADMAALEEDIATYGIYECRTDASYSRAEYDMLRMKYVNVAVGKGLTTMDVLISGNNEYHELTK